MKKIAFWSVLFLCALVNSALAQDVEVIDVKGSVSVRLTSTTNWQQAQPGLLLNQDSEIRTGANSQCVIAFGYQRRNIVTIEKNTQIIVEKVVPGTVFLPKGRVFTLIKDIDDEETFEVRTPTAVAGARGTGWITEFNNNRTAISVLEDNVLVSGLDQNGRVVDQFEIQQDFRTEVSFSGRQRNFEPVPQADRQRWNNNVQKLNNVIPELKQKPINPVQPKVSPNAKPNVKSTTQVKQVAQKQNIKPNVNPNINPPVGDQPNPDGEFQQYMQDQGLTKPPLGEGEDGFVGGQPYQGDQFFGGFDQQWDSVAGQFARDRFFHRKREKFQTFFDKPPLPPDCHCPEDCSIPHGETCPNHQGPPYP